MYFEFFGLANMWQHTRNNIYVVLFSIMFNAIFYWNITVNGTSYIIIVCTRKFNNLIPVDDDEKTWFKCQREMGGRIKMSFDTLLRKMVNWSVFRSKIKIRYIEVYINDKISANVKPKRKRRLTMKSKTKRKEKQQKKKQETRNERKKIHQMKLTKKKWSKQTSEQT